MVTDRVTIGAAALTAVLRDPLYLAHVLVTLDQLVSERLEIALGTGYPLSTKNELDAVTTTYRERAGRVDEAVRFWKRHWSGDDRDFAGQVHGPLGPGAPVDAEPARWPRESGWPATASHAPSPGRAPVQHADRAAAGLPAVLRRVRGGLYGLARRVRRRGARHIVLRMGSFDHYERNVRAIADGVMPALHAMNLD
jgi:Luciferase-like monooxygenase